MSNPGYSAFSGKRKFAYPDVESGIFGKAIDALYGLHAMLTRGKKKRRRRRRR